MLSIKKTNGYNMLMCSSVIALRFNDSYCLLAKDVKQAHACFKFHHKFDNFEVTLDYCMMITYCASEFLSKEEACWHPRIETDTWIVSSK